MMVMNLGFSPSNFQRMGESLCLERVIVRYVCMISEQISLALESLLTWYYIVFTYNWLLFFVTQIELSIDSRSYLMFHFYVAV
jgi:hypothetical protein